VITRSINRMMILNRYYRMTRFYHFMSKMMIKTGIVLGIFILLFFLVDFFILDTDALLQTIATRYSPMVIFSLFFTSELLMGILPPEMFIAWSSKTLNPWFHVFIFGTLSYAVGLGAYYLGKGLIRVSSVKKFIELKIAKHISNLRKWGGFLVFVGAMLPLPYTLVSIASGLINFKIKHYLAWALFRYVRFFAYSLIIFKVL
jgi:membrane protein YqaA with SNARE-associated domain